MNEARPRRLGKIRSSLTLESLPLDVLAELSRPRRLGKMRSKVSKEALKEVERL